MPSPGATVPRAASMSTVGSRRYKPGPNQSTPAQMRWRAVPIEMLVRLRRGDGKRRLDVLLTHAPPEGFSGKENDLAHRGFPVFNRLIKTLAPAARARS